MSPVLSVESPVLYKESPLKGHDRIVNAAEIQFVVQKMIILEPNNKRKREKYAKTISSMYYIQ